MFSKANIQEAFKLAISMVLMYWLALWMDWDMPKYAYFPVDVPAGPSREANLPVYPVIHSNPTVFHLFD